jgi:hypothetical protein
LRERVVKANQAWLRARGIRNGILKKGMPHPAHHRGSSKSFFKRQIGNGQKMFQQ